ncbi:MAG: hypothetical protein B7Y45_05500 [Sphingomonas sp. 28-66-16]|nr:MAG: hypothetical protein B7Y45_05500 [Sphingomonas sp. 28-66-16]
MRFADLMRSLSWALAAMTLSVPAQAQMDAAPASPPAAVQGKFLQLSDIHFDPFADPTLFAKLNDAPVDQWEAIFAASAAPALPSRSKQDTNYPLLKSALAAAQSAGPFDYIVYTGDYLSHGFVPQLQGYIADPATQKAFTVKTVDFVNLMIAEAFPAVPLVATLGNNDSACGDYNLTPDADILAGVGDDLPLVHAAPGAESDFDKGGYYLVPHPTVANLDFVVLSVFWSRKYVNQCAPGAPDPATAQLQWLTATLAAEQASGRHVTFLMHIPPGIDGYSASSKPTDPPSPLWTASDSYLSYFESLTAQYKDLLVGGFAGHTHMDEFRVLADSTPYLAIKMAPSVSPYNGNRPAFTVFSYDPATGAAIDYTVTTQANFGTTGPGTPAVWAKEYSFGEAYGFARYDAASAQQLAAKTIADPATRALYGQYYASGNPSPAGKPGSWFYFSCALDRLSATPYQGCVDANKPRLRKPARRLRQKGAGIGANP